MPNWDLGLSPCHFLARKFEVSEIGTTSHAHAHTHTHTHTHTHRPIHECKNKRAALFIYYSDIKQLHAQARKHSHTHTTQIRPRCCSWLSVSPKYHFPGHLSSGAADGDVHVDGVCQRSSQTTARLLRVVCVHTHRVSLTD